jgi:hypothetical protein
MAIVLSGLYHFYKSCSTFFCFCFWELALVAPTAMAMVLKWLVAYNYKSLVSPNLEFFFLNVAASLIGGVKFVFSPLYFEGRVFGYKGVNALVVYQAIMRLHMCDFL